MKYMLIEVMEREISDEDIAWAERYGKNYDWKIFAVERGTSTQAPATPLFNTLR